MDASTWIALLALVVAAGWPALGKLTEHATRDGKIDTAIEHLTAIAGDHESRLRKGGL